MSGNWVEVGGNYVRETTSGLEDMLGCEKVYPSMLGMYERTKEGAEGFTTHLYMLALLENKQPLSQRVESFRQWALNGEQAVDAYASCLYPSYLGSAEKEARVTARVKNLFLRPDLKHLYVRIPIFIAVLGGPTAEYVDVYAIKPSFLEEIENLFDLECMPETAEEAMPETADEAMPETAEEAMPETAEEDNPQGEAIFTEEAMADIAERDNQAWQESIYKAYLHDYDRFT